MIDLDYLTKLLALLQTSNVATFEFGDLKLTFHVEQKLKPIEKPQEPPADESILPPDLRTDNITDYDKILNWSGSPDLDESLPLTGEHDL